MSFECFSFAFEWLESLSNGSNWHSIASNLVRMFRICIRMVRIPFEWFEFAFDGFEFRSNGSNFGIEWLEHPYRLVQICVRLFWISFESLSNGSNLHSIASKLFRMLRICIRMVRIPFEWFECTFDCFESRSNLHSNGYNPCRIVRMCIRLLPMSFEFFAFAFEWLESLSNGSNLHSSASNTF